MYPGNTGNGAGISNSGYHSHTHIHILIYTLGKLELPGHLVACFWEMGGNLCGHVEKIVACMHDSNIFPSYLYYFHEEKVKFIAGFFSKNVNERLMSSFVQMNKRRQDTQKRRTRIPCDGSGLPGRLHKVSRLPELPEELKEHESRQNVLLGVTLDGSL